jgi:hypothetical protein
MCWRGLREELQALLTVRGELGAAAVRQDAEAAVVRLHGGRGVPISPQSELDRRAFAYRHGRPA